MARSMLHYWGAWALGMVYREEITTISHVPCATSARGWVERGPHVVCEAVATTVRWCWLASSHSFSFLTDHLPAQSHCRQHAVARMGATVRQLHIPQALSLPHYTQSLFVS